MKSHKFGGLVTAVGLMVGLASHFGLRAQDGRDDREEKLKALLQQRREALQMRVERLEQLVELGTAGAERVLTARIDLLDADLETAATRLARIEIHKKRIEIHRKLEDLARIAARAPRQPAPPGRRRVDEGPDRYMLARAARIQAEIDMLREEMGS